MGSWAEKRKKERELWPSPTNPKLPKFFLLPRCRSEPYFTYFHCLTFPPNSLVDLVFECSPVCLAKQIFLKISLDNCSCFRKNIDLVFCFSKQNSRFANFMGMDESVVNNPIINTIPCLFKDLIQSCLEKLWGWFFSQKYTATGIAINTKVYTTGLVEIKRIGWGLTQFTKASGLDLSLILHWKNGKLQEKKNIIKSSPRGYLATASLPINISIPHLRSAEYKRSRLPKNRRTANRPYGGVISGITVREKIIRAFLVEEQKIVKKVLKIQKTKEKQAVRS